MITYLLIAFSTVCNLFAQLALKHVVSLPVMRSALQEGPLAFVFAMTMERMTWLALCLQISGYLVWFFVLARAKFAVAFAFSGALFYLMTAIAAWQFFDERLTVSQWFGLTLISSGVFLMARQA
jgi:drug/metabolite transporter (DMT)-like permease